MNAFLRINFLQNLTETLKMDKISDFCCYFVYEILNIKSANC